MDRKEMFLKFAEEIKEINELRYLVTDFLREARDKDDKEDLIRYKRQTTKLYARFTQTLKCAEIVGFEAREVEKKAFDLALIERMIGGEKQ